MDATNSLVTVLVTANGVKNTLSSIGTNPLKDDVKGGKTVEGEDTDKLVDAGGQFGFYAILLTVTGAIGFGILSTVMVSSGIVDLSSILLAAVIAPAVAIQKFKLLKLGDFRGQHNTLRTAVGRFHDENTKLTSSIDAMETEVTKLDSIQSELKEIADKSGTSIDKLQSLLQENAELQKQMISILQNQVLQQIVTASLSSDVDKDFVLDSEELDVLLMRLQNIKGVKVDVDKVKSFLGSGTLTYADFIDIARDLQEDTLLSTKTDVSSKLQFFTFEPNVFLDQ